MAGTNVFRGDAPAVSQVDHIVITADDASTSYRVTCNGKTVSITGAGTGVNDTAAALQAALAATQTIPEFTEITWTVSSATVIATASTPGTPFTISATTSGGTGTLSHSTTTANSGPNDPTVGQNWTLGMPTQSVSQVWTVDLGGPASGTFTLTFGGHTTSPALNYNDPASAVQSALVALVSIGTGNVSVSGSAGGPYTVTFTGTLAYQALGALTGDGSGLTGGTFLITNVVTGVTGDDIILDSSSVDLLYNLGNFGVYNSLTITASYTGKIGLPTFNALGYYEYRPLFWGVSVASVIGASSNAITIGQGQGSGSNRIKIDVGTVQATVNVFLTGTPADAGQQTLLLKGNASSGNVVNAYEGSVGLDTDPGTTGNWPTITVAYESQPSSDVSLICGSGVALGTITQFGGNVLANSSVTDWTITAGTGTLQGTGTATTLTIDGGTLYWNSSGTITAADVAPGGSLDLSGSALACTVTHLRAAKGSKVYDPFDRLTLSNGVFVIGCRLSDVTLDLGVGQTFNKVSTDPHWS